MTEYLLILVGAVFVNNIVRFDLSQPGISRRMLRRHPRVEVSSVI